MAIKDEDADEATWTNYLQSMGLAGSDLSDVEKLRSMLMELSSFPVLTKYEKFSLVNLAEVEVTSTNTVEGATLCDICLAVPNLNEWPSQDEVRRLC